MFRRSNSLELSILQRETYSKENAMQCNKIMNMEIATNLKR